MHTWVKLSSEASVFKSPTLLWKTKTPIGPLGWTLVSHWNHLGVQGVDGCLYLSRKRYPTSFTQSKDQEPEMAHTFNPTLRGQKQVDLCVSEANLVYILSSRPARTTKRDPVQNLLIKKKKSLVITHTSLVPSLKGIQVE